MRTGTPTWALKKDKEKDKRGKEKIRQGREKIQKVATEQRTELKSQKKQIFFSQFKPRLYQESSN